jgi:hypothetical protein
MKLPTHYYSKKGWPGPSSSFYLLFIAFSLLCLLIDLSQFFIIGTVITPTLIALYCALLLDTLPREQLFFIALLQCLATFCFYNYFLLPLLYLLPLTAFAYYCKKNLYPSLIGHSIILMLLWSVINMFIIEKCILSIPFDPYYTIIKIGATIIVELSFSLTIKYWGEQDNRA